MTNSDIPSDHDEPFLNIEKLREKSDSLSDEEDDDDSCFGGYITEISNLAGEDTFNPVEALYQGNLQKLEKESRCELPPYTTAFFQFLEITGEFNRKTLSSADTLNLLDELNMYLERKIERFGSILNLNNDEKKVVEMIVTGFDGIKAAINLSRYAIETEHCTTISNDIVHVGRDADSIISQTVLLFKSIEKHE